MEYPNRRPDQVEVSGPWVREAGGSVYDRKLIETWRSKDGRECVEARRIRWMSEVPQEDLARLNQHG